MVNSTVSPQNQPHQDRAIWLSLRQAISKSSGFKRWQQELNLDNEANLDIQVRRYLEETLETLAY